MAVKGAVIDILQAAREDHDSVVEPPRDLVRIPSRGGIDAYGPIFAHIAARLQDGAGGFGGSVVMLFDVDEHTGGFGGAKAYFEDAGAARGVDSMCQEVATRSETR